MNGILQSYFFKNQIKANSNSIAQKPCTTGKNLSFTGDAVNIVQEIPDTYPGMDETYTLTDIYTPRCGNINRNATASIVKNNNIVEFKFKPSKCHNEKEEYQMFSAALYTAIKRAQKFGAKEVIFEPSGQNEKNFALDAGFKETQNNNVYSISKEHFDEIIGNEKSIGNLEKTMLQNVDEMKKVDEVSDKFKSRSIPLDELSSKASFIQEDGKIYLVNSKNNSSIGINGSFLNLNENKQITSGDTIRVDSDIYIFNASKKPELRFITQDNNNIFEELFPSGINHLGFNEYRVNGDCYFLAALNSVSKNPNGAELIAKMIELTPDKKYKVTFPAYPKESFIVNPKDIKDSVQGDFISVR